MGAPAFSAYSASKAGLLGMMRSVAQDGAPHGITCNSLLPGWVRSEMTELSAAHDAEQMGISVAEVWKQRDASYAAGRTIEPDEVGNAIAFFCSKQSSGISGEEIRVALGGAW
jgi:NAD(P)-dependent dehydrogenase (short-subunit alcohol dehydrogenase family)